MSDLETTIRRLAKAGNLNNLSLAFAANGMFEAYYRGVDDKDKRICSHPDPVSAMEMALTGRKIEMPAKPAKVTKALEPLAPAAATAAPSGSLLSDLF